MGVLTSKNTAQNGLNQQTNNYVKHSTKAIPMISDIYINTQTIKTQNV